MTEKYSNVSAERLSASGKKTAGRFEDWVKEVIEDVDHSIKVGYLEDDGFEVYDYLKTNYRANNPEDVYDRMVSEVMDWHKKRK